MLYAPQIFPSPTKYTTLGNTGFIVRICTCPSPPPRQWGDHQTSTLGCEVSQEHKFHFIRVQEHLGRLCHSCCPRGCGRRGGRSPRTQRSWTHPITMVFSRTFTPKQDNQEGFAMGRPVPALAPPVWGLVEGALLAGASLKTCPNPTQPSQDLTQSNKPCITMETWSQQ